MCDLFSTICQTNFVSYADDNVIKSFYDDFIQLFKWFLDNQMKAYSNKCHLVTSKQSYMNLKIGNIILKTVLVKNY